MPFPGDFLPNHARTDVVVLTPAMVDERGELVADWSAPLETPAPGCIAHDGGISSDWQHAAALKVDRTVYFPPDQEPPALFRIRFPDSPETFSLKGEVKRWIYGLRIDCFAVELERRRDGL
ncbi:hypothetical protein BLJ79_21590 [Arthrobacter sp. UCD-GKA]|uniref:hypothetical protein n=1 Tax=Arthrobacter sp. UCD-GKA TaxID=1913576 RepID=UPI0008DE13E3|nr:hypothetical protein [Arthrobacter sp. UCD-GKA]OIH81954.1 hypothetical protein BLJ79_21590 [Arthrobacter sp. UCD-GKA]